MHFSFLCTNSEKFYFLQKFDKIQFHYTRRLKRDEASNITMQMNSTSLLSDEMSNLTGIMYKPKTQDTKQIYETLLSFIQAALGDQPRDVLCGAVDEVLVVLKNEKMREKDKRKEVEGLLGNMADERFALLVNLCKKITDWTSSDKHLMADELDEATGINVQFEGQEEEEMDEEDLYGEVREEDDEETGVEAVIDVPLKANVRKIFL